ncbi:MAG: M48 family metalloprotease [Chthonomonadales bacterium]|nr:M48 family metalloprotease [Chthonomonadales bacterium]
MTKRARRAALPLLVALAAMAAEAVAQAQLGLVSQSQELKAGREADAQIRQTYRISHDPALNARVRTIGRKLARASDRPDIPWTFRVIESDDINAFSVPGYVYVNTGLIQAVDGHTDELAGVIAHEVGHTAGRHAAKQMEKSFIGGLIGEMIGGNRFTTQLVNVAENLILLGYSRDDENDADRRAVKYLLRAGYDPNGLVRFFKLLQKKESKAPGLLTYFRTHPPTGDRIERVREQIRKQRD